MKGDIKMKKRFQMEFLDQYGDEDNLLGAWGVYDTLDSDRNFGTETFADKNAAMEFMFEKNNEHEGK